MAATETTAATALAADAARCVKCALCLPHCPTYRLKGEEGDSPRGRIELIWGLAEGSLAPAPDVIAHLDGCLACRACEAVCPAGVPYGRLIDGARAELAPRRTGTLLLRFIKFSVTHPRALATVFRALRPLALRMLPSTARLRPFFESARTLALARGDGEPVALFLGCIARTADAATLMASSELLAAAGYRIEAPRGQSCCGALAAHDGDRRQAAALARRNAEAFAAHERIVASATGCTAQLAEYDGLLEDGGAFSRKVADVTELLAVALESGRLTIHNDKRLRVALHVPCTQRNVLRSSALERSLAAIPNVETVTLPPGCCGAAGSYFLSRPHDADRLRNPLLDAIRAARPDYVVTANIGCRLHLAAGLGKGAPDVLHLASFLAGLRDADRKG